ncbi:LytR/AlgR family response regulator transcription factor [Lacrimispora saccharolytica]|uniref:Stage 0 sporulation protein A homolog n=1 Tax=Lacrimispora saccharolytica (strain ATCC 35040 / DSM 2544 / NRCC 2533 / WM1) TaxID=610130 RepID=D9R1Z7_LACSW|nr:LytTR family DNA-binding domain-containing protein [Lacrimispora saccharolytica]ADL02888.1 two component transcriptional regulator, LytTR family [[Clostridium] saccharolyticum WM1]QRV18914.1 response regulator transcription factor [Lacrimispora saccharolytica]
MLRIAICDDSREDRKRILDFVRDYYKTHDMDVQIDDFESAGKLLSAEDTYDIYLLDVIMPDMTGIETAKKLLKKKEAPVIIFITSSLESAVDGYRVNASGFVLKPLVERDFEETLKRVMEQNFKSREASISIVHNRVPMELKLSRILYFENRLHRVYIVLKSGEVLSVHQKLNEIQEELKAQTYFIRCHQSYIVNLNHVEALENAGFVMTNGDLVPVSRNFYKECKHVFYHFQLK